ncbi:MAG: hypothetical protein ABR556_13770, partial [Pyrinomonadaceae bacterium]
SLSDANSSSKCRSDFIPKHSFAISLPVLRGKTNTETAKSAKQAQRVAKLNCISTRANSEDMTVAGDIKPELFISSSGTDSDFVVKLIDVFRTITNTQRELNRLQSRLGVCFSQVTSDVEGV